MSHLLFVIGMEYLSRTLIHPRCKKLGLNHLIFADDLLMMCIGDSSSIQVLVESIIAFSKVSDLTPNFNKSAIFLVSIGNSHK